MVDDIIQKVIDNFDFTYVVVVNIMTYAIIKFIDDANGDKPVGTWIKRIVLIVSIVVVGYIYFKYNNANIEVIFNSAILAPVAWSWVLKPICKKVGIDYKQIDKVIN